MTLISPDSLGLQNDYCWFSLTERIDLTDFPWFQNNNDLDFSFSCIEGLSCDLPAGRAVLLPAGTVIILNL